MQSSLCQLLCEEQDSPMCKYLCSVLTESLFCKDLKQLLGRNILYRQKTGLCSEGTRGDPGGHCGWSWGDATMGMRGAGWLMHDVET